MPLEPLIILSDLSDAADEFLLQDDTGLYAADNPGGYNTPNIAKADVDSLLIELWNEGDEESVDNYEPESISLFLAGGAQELTVQDFGGEENAYFTDGVLNIRYNVLLSIVPLTSISTSGKIIHALGADSDESTGDDGFRGDETVVVVEGKSYLVDTTKNNSTHTLYLLTAIPTDTEGVYPGYYGEDQLLNQKHLESKLVKAIAKWAGNCDCSDTEVLMLMKVLMKTVGSGGRFDCDDFTGAQQIIGTATNDLTGACGC